MPSEIFTKQKQVWKSIRHSVFIFPGLLLAWVMVQCTPQTAELSLPLEYPENFSAAGKVEVPDRWWTVFGDDKLDSLVEQALESNFDLETAWQRLREAQAIADRESSFLFPDLQGFLEAEKTRLEGFENEQLRLGPASTYEVDLWGRISSRIEAAQYRTAASLADYQTAALTLAAEVARTWYQLAETENELNLLDEQIETNSRILDLISNRFGSGQLQMVDILRQRQLLEATREQKIVRQRLLLEATREQKIIAESRLQVLEHQLAVLLGRTPGKKLEYHYGSLPELPPLPDPGLPVELIRRRPDVRRAHKLFQAADQDMAAAMSNRFPRLTLAGSASTADGETYDLFEEWAYSFAGSLAAPLFDAGRRDAEVDRTEALKKQRLYEYGQTVLNALKEVEDALIRERKQTERIRSLNEQVALARQTYERLRVQYFNGTSDYINVLTSLIEEQRLRRDLLTAELLLLELRIALYRALAGGFQTLREHQQDSAGDLTLRMKPVRWIDHGYQRFQYDYTMGETS